MGVAVEFGSWLVEMVVELVVAAKAWVVYLVVEVLGHSPLLSHPSAALGPMGARGDGAGPDG